MVRAMAIFYAKLTGNRPNFATTMTPEERTVMAAHGVFLKEQLAAGKLVVAGPVMDPAGGFGMGVFEAASLEEVQAITRSDPANAVGRYDIIPMGPSTFRNKP